MSDIIHASAVALSAKSDAKAVLLLGPSGSGKSTLAARLMDAYAAQLIGDDRIHLSVEAAKIMVAPHEKLAGLLELRGLGLLRMDYLASAPLALVVQLVEERSHVPRLPDGHYFTHQGIDVPKLTLHGADLATPLIISKAITALAHGFRDDAIYPA